VDEVGGAVERIDDPQVVAVLGPMCASRFLGQDAVARIGLEQRVDDHAFRCVVDLGDEVVRVLDVDLQQVDVERCAIDDRARRARRLDGDVEHRMQGLGHGREGRSGCGGNGGGERTRRGEGPR
jgi:hypothetical protein